MSREINEKNEPGLLGEKRHEILANKILQERRLDLK